MGFFLSHLEKKGFPLSPFELSTVYKYCVNINRCGSAAEKSVISKGAHAYGTSTDPVSMGSRLRGNDDDNADAPPAASAQAGSLEAFNRRSHRR
jgi:hypothetical protein